MILLWQLETLICVSVIKTIWKTKITFSLMFSVMKIPPHFRLVIKILPFKKKSYLFLLIGPATYLWTFASKWISFNFGWKNCISGYGLYPKSPQSLKVLYLIPWLSMALLVLSHTRLCSLNYLLDSTLLRGWTHRILRPLIFGSPHSFPLYLMQDGFFPVFFTANV